MDVNLRQKVIKIIMFKAVVKNVFFLSIGVSLGYAAYYTVGEIYTGVKTKVQNINVSSSLLPEVDDADSKEPKTALQTSNVKMVDLTDEKVIHITGPIGRNAFNVSDAIKLAARSGDPIWVLIDSPGGSVIAGAQIISAIESAGVEVNTVCLSLCASMGAIIHQHGTKRYMVDRSFLMFHEASGGVSGTMPQMLSQLKSMNRYINKMIAKIATRAGISFKDLSSKLAAELWIDAEDSLASHFSDGTINVLFDPSRVLNSTQGFEERVTPYLPSPNRGERHKILDMQL